jgi:hypothetical protein
MIEDVRRIPKKDFKGECPYCRSQNTDHRQVSGAAAGLADLSAVYDTGVRFCPDCRGVFLLID